MAEPPPGWTQAEPTGEDAGPEPLVEVVGAQADVLAAVAAGGALGSLLRWALTEVMAAGGIAWPTLLVNLAGALALGALTGRLATRPQRAHRLLRPFVGVGLLGGFTTFSTYVHAVVELRTDMPVFTAGSYLVLSVLLGIAAAYCGYELAADPFAEES